MSGYEVATAGSVEAALSMLDAPGSFAPDIIVSDVIDRSGMGGIRLFEAARARPALTHVPFLFISAREHAEIEDLMRRDRVVQFVRKPFEVAQLLQEVDHVATGHQSHAASGGGEAA